MTQTFISGTKCEKPRSDLRVRYSPTKDPLSITIESSVKKMFGKTILDQAKSVCKDLQVSTGKLEIEDFDAESFVIAARIEAVVKQANPSLELESLPPMKDCCLEKSKKNRFRRSRLYIPGNKPKMMKNIWAFKPDGISLDLEDSVLPADKEDTRYVVRNALRSLDFFRAERMVRVNKGEMGLKDLEFVVPHNVHLILLPKVESANEIKKVEDRILEISKECGRKEPVYLIPILESSLGILKALEIAEASLNNVALAIGLEDYTTNLGVQRTKEGKESFFARSMLVNAARATGLQAIDGVYSKINDEQGLRYEINDAKKLGFNGKACIHPQQIEPIHDGFAPTDIEIKDAMEIVIEFEEADAKGLGVTLLDNEMIDLPIVRKALTTINLAIASDLLKSDWKNHI